MHTQIGEDLADGSETLNPIDKEVAGDLTKERVGLVEEVGALLLHEDNVDKTFHHLASFQFGKVCHVISHVQARTYCKMYKKKIYYFKFKIKCRRKTLKKNT